MLTSKQPIPVCTYLHTGW